MFAIASCWTSILNESLISFSGLTNLPGQNLLQFVGGQAQKQTHFVSLFTSRFLVGLYTNKSPLRSPLDSVNSEYYHMGATDSLIDGLNSELSVASTIIRRPGNPKFSTVETSTAIDFFYSFHESTGAISVIADSLTDVEVVTPTAINSLFVKSSGAGEGSFQGIDTSLYISDGVDTVKYIPGRPGDPALGASVYNWGGAAPLIAPTFQITETGSAGVLWVASTMWTTMGLIEDSNGNIEQMISVDASGTNTTQLGTTGNGTPAFSLNPGGTQTSGADGSITSWTNWGPIVLWSSNTLYNNNATGGTNANPCAIYDPISNSGWINGTPGGVQATSGATPPHFVAGVGNIIHDGGVKWFCYWTGSFAPPLWKKNTTYAGSSATPGSYVITPVLVQAAGLGSTSPSTVYLQLSSGGTSLNGNYSPVWATGVGLPTFDGDLIWNNLGSATRQNLTTYIPWASGSDDFGVIKDVNGNLQVCISSTGPTGSSAPTFATVYGQQTQDGANAGTSSFVGVTWYCVGTSLSWAATTQWYLPTSGFVPPQPSQPFGGATLVDTNGNNEYVINSGLSQTPGPPSWAALGHNTTDGTVTWFALDPFTSAGFSWTVGFGYAYSYKARMATDAFVLTSPPLQIPGTNSPNITGPLGPPTGAADGTVTTSSPVGQIVGGNSGAQILITMVGSTDPQFDTIEVYRSADGFGAGGPYLFLTDIPMPPVVGGVAGIAQIIDFMPDLATALLPGLNPLIVAPIANENDPPPGQFGSTQFVSAGANPPTLAAPGTALQGPEYHQGRVWGFIGNTVFASGGPDTDPGNGFTAFPPGNAFPFDSQVIKLLSTSAGLVVFTTTDVGFIGGGPAITQYTPQVIVPGLGILSANCVTTIAGVPYVFSSDRQIIGVDPNGGITRVSHNIGDKLALFDPSMSYLTYLSYGDQDNALFIGDGSTQWYRGD